MSFALLIWVLCITFTTYIGFTFLRRASSKPERKQVKSSRSMTIAALVAVAVIGGHALSAQVALSALPLASLKTVKVPEPDNLGAFIKDKQAAIALGKSLYWDMQVGSDGKQSCATCHLHAGTDSRSKNTISTGLNRVNLDRTLNPDAVFNTVSGPNSQLKSENFPFHKLSNPNDRFSTVKADSNDVVGSQGQFNATYVDIVTGSAQEKMTVDKDKVFNVKGINVRRVTPRNAPSSINAVFNHRNFWDGRAQNVFNGVNPFGLRDKDAAVLKAVSENQIKKVKISLKNSSLASVATTAPISDEMSSTGRMFGDISQKLDSLTPLGKQLVHPEDSVLGNLSNWPQPGIHATYESMIAKAFKPEWYKSKLVVRVGKDGERTFVDKPVTGLSDNEYTMMDDNFSLFMGLSIQTYLSTLIANDTPFDRYLAGNLRALTESQKGGFEIFQTRGKCIKCHAGAELTNASVASVQEEPLSRMEGEAPVHDNGFNNIGVRPILEDLGIGGVDPFGNPLSRSRLAQQGKFHDPKLDPPLRPRELVIADGGFKVPGLRNVELTAPYFHNGGQLTLQQVVEFYNRGGDFNGLPNLNPNIQRLELTEQNKGDLVAFLKSLTDDRVRYQKAPFDHPQLFIPNGHPQGQTAGLARDAMLEIPAVGRNGGRPLPNFLNNS